MGTETPTTQPDKQVTVPVPEDRVPEFYAFYARFLAGDGPRRRGGRRGPHRGHGPGHHGRCHPHRDAAHAEHGEHPHAEHHAEAGHDTDAPPAV